MFKEENMLTKNVKIILLFLISTFSLTGCKETYNYEFTPPDISEYILSDVFFDDYVSSQLTDFHDLNEQALTGVSFGNVLIKNISYSDNGIFAKKDRYSGSGVIFSETENYYYALTNYHVVEKHRDFDFQLFEVWDYFNNRYDGFIYEGGMDYDLDLAIVVFQKSEQSLSVIEILDGQIEVEKAVVAIGNPLGEVNVITSGHILRYGKTRTTNRYDETKTNEFLSIIHSAQIQSGSSGGMLLNLDLKIIGINYASTHHPDNPESFAIPSHLIVAFITTLTNSI
jgi:S1-C subfamily serine protease